MTETNGYISYKCTEILAPAGSFEALTAAVRCGADAVYLGGKDFNARRNAGNFDDTGLRDAAEFCHSHGAKLYLTLNTLLSDSEIQKAIYFVERACIIGADALILQDLGLINIIKNIAPDMPLHASTQMSVQTLSGIGALKNMGFSRVVLPRELSKAELLHIATESPLELEIFVHGAHCMSVSGQCYMSSFLGGRSGNRGLCAQPCRLPFAVENGTGHDLSLKDLSLIKQISEGCLNGISSLKIEGRMKRPEYVAAAVTACKNALNGDISDELLHDLQSVFSRSGFTDGYFIGKRGKDMFGIRTKDDVTAAEPIFKKLQKLYANENGLIPVDFDFIMKKNSKAELSAKALDICVKAVSEQAAEPALTSEISADKVFEQLHKCGGTQFYTDKINIDIEESLYISLSEINTLRRSVLTSLSDKLSETKIHKFIKTDLLFPENNSPESTGLFACFYDVNAIPDDISSVARIFIPIDTHLSDIERLQQKTEVGVMIPRGIFGSDQNLRKKLTELRAFGINTSLAGTLDAIEISKECGIEPVAGFGTNIFNSFALEYMHTQGLKYALCSPEMTLKQIASVRSEIKRGIVVYGNIQLMLTRNCPVSNGKPCSECKKNGSLKDRMNIEFPVLCQNGCAEILNSRPLYMLDKLSDIKNIHFHFMIFTTENKAECQKHLEAYGHNSPSEEAFTRGLYYKGV